MRNNKNSLLLLLLAAAILVVVAVNQAKLQKQLVEKNSQISSLEGKVANFERLSSSHGLLLSALETIELLKAKDMQGLSARVHPDKGLRFTPYPCVDLQADQVFTAQEVAGLPQDTTVYQWGVFDGSGEPIKLDFNGYYQRFIYDHDFAQPQLIGNNQIVGTGNTVDNVAAAYPEGEFIEFHFAGFDSQYAGLDWSSLKLVFEQKNDVWYLVGIIHGEWTI